MRSLQAGGFKIQNVFSTVIYEMLIDVSHHINESMDYDYFRAGVADVILYQAPNSHNRVHFGLLDYVSAYFIFMSKDYSIRLLQAQAGIGKCIPVHLVI